MSMPSSQSRTAAALVLLGLFVPGCLTETEEDPQAVEDDVDPLLDSRVLDAPALGRALDNQASLEEAGLQLVGRAWVGRASYVGYYLDVNREQNVLRFTAARDLPRGEETEPEDGESFDAYVARMAPGGAVTLGDLPHDVLLFVPEPQTRSEDGALGVRSDALTPLEEVALILETCTRTSREFCARPVGWEYFSTQPMDVSTWNRFQVPSHTARGRGNSFSIAVCAHGGGATVDLQFSNPSRDALPTSRTLDIGPLEQFKTHNVGTLSEHRECWSRFLFFACSSYSFETDFQEYDMVLSARGKSGSSFQSDCGKITRNGYVFRFEQPENGWCSALGRCRGLRP